MKKLCLVVVCSLLAGLTFGQKCLDISIGNLLGQLQVPGAAASCFGNCVTTKNNNGQTVISNYGTAYSQLDTMLNNNMRAFTMAPVVNAGSPAMPSAASVQSYKDLATQLQGMSEDERKAYAMKLAAQMQTAYMQSPPVVAENPAAVQLVGQTRSLVSEQLVPLDYEFAMKLRDLQVKEKAARDSVPTPSYKNCPQANLIGVPGCSCVNGLDGAYWQQIVAIEDRYNIQKAALLQSYLPRIKALVASVEANISKLHGGDDVKNLTFKQMLFSAQSSAFSSAFDTSARLVKDMQQTGSDAYVNKYNADNLVYSLNCIKGK